MVAEDLVTGVDVALGEGEKETLWKIAFANSMTFFSGSSKTVTLIDLTMFWMRCALINHKF